MRRKFLLLIAVMILFTGTVYADDTLESKTVKGVKVNIVTIDLKSGDYTIGVSTGKNETNLSEPFSSQIKRNGADIAVNGNFFDAYSKQGKRRFYSDIFKNGELISGGSRGTIGFLSDNTPIYYNYLEGSYEAPDGIVSAVSGDPTTVYQGQNSVGKFETTRKDVDEKAARTNMGYTEDGKIIIATSSSATIRQMGDVMKELGCVYAVNLDGGASSALYYRGNMVTTPGRELNVVLYFKGGKKQENKVNKPQDNQPKKENNAKAVVKDNFKISMNGEILPYKPILINGSTYLPVRLIGYAVNAKVDYDTASRKINMESISSDQQSSKLPQISNISGIKVANYVGNMSLYVDGNYFKESKSQIVVIDGSSYLPLRAVSEITKNTNVKWDNNTKTVVIENSSMDREKIKSDIEKVTTEKITAKEITEFKYDDVRF